MTEKALTKTEIREAGAELQNIKFKLKTGQISYEAARVAAEPHFKILNIYAKETAKIFNVRAKVMSFTAYMR